MSNHDCGSTGASCCEDTREGRRLLELKRKGYLIIQENRILNALDGTSWVRLGQIFGLATNLQAHARTVLYASFKEVLTVSEAESALALSQVKDGLEIFETGFQRLYEQNIERIKTLENIDAQKKASG